MTGRALIAALLVFVDVLYHWTDPLVVRLRDWLAVGAAILCKAVIKPLRLIR